MHDNASPPDVDGSTELKDGGEDPLQNTGRQIVIQGKQKPSMQALSRFLVKLSEDILIDGRKDGKV